MCGKNININNSTLKVEMDEDLVIVEDRISIDSWALVRKYEEENETISVDTRIAELNSGKISEPSSVPAIYISLKTS
jgi:hypothetical protein